MGPCMWCLQNASLCTYAYTCILICVCWHMQIALAHARHVRDTTCMWTSSCIWGNFPLQWLQGYGHVKVILASSICLVPDILKCLEPVQSIINIIIAIIIIIICHHRHHHQGKTKFYCPFREIHKALARTGVEMQVSPAWACESFKHPLQVDVMTTTSETTEILELSRQLKR